MARKTRSRGGRVRRYAGHVKTKAKMHIAQLVMFALSLVPTFERALTGYREAGWRGAWQYPLYGWSGIAFKPDGSFDQWNPRGMGQCLAPFIALNGIGWGISKAATKFGVNRAMPRGWGV